MQYTPEQQHAIDMALTERVMILTGGPGTGKTTTLRGILQELRRADLFYKMCAPTGRAAKRMREQTGQHAETIHRLLEYHPEQGFRRDKLNRLETDVVICDEASMIDVELMQRLTDALPTGCRLILIGDADQLQSVGPGNVLRDMIASGDIPVARLTQIQRQAAGSLIVQNATRIISGMPIETQNMIGGDFFFQRTRSEEEAVDCVVRKVSDGLPKFLPEGSEIQVLSPMRKENVLAGCTELNKALQAAINPDGQRIIINKQEWRVGDRVMNVKNDYDQQLYNGDTGEIVGGSASDKVLHVDFDGRVLDIKGTALTNLTLAYATTVHKAQGSEYDAAVIILTPGCAYGANRHLLYTAVTRAKRLCLLVGDKDTIEATIRNDRVAVRNTRLAERLAE